MKESTIQKLSAWFAGAEEKLTKRITPATLAVILTMVYLLSLVPLLWIGWYNYPSADDYSIGSNCRQIWVESHNVFAVIWAGIVRSAEDWLTWMGYYTSNFLMAIPPSVFGERLYVLTVWIMLVTLSVSTWYLLHNIFVKVMKADKYRSHCVIMLMLFVTVQCMVGRVEAFYWYAGAANYMLVHGLSLFYYGLLIGAVYDKGKKRTFDLVMAGILGFLCGGGNQMTALNMAVVLLVVLALGVVFRKWKQQKALWIPIGLFLFGFVLNIAAPGNWVRAEGTNGMNPIKAVMVSFYYCLDYCVNQWSGWPVLLLVIALIPLFFRMAKKTSFSFPYPLVVVLFGYCLVSAMLTPPLFAVGNMEAARLQAVTFAMYILVLTLCTGYVTGWASKKWDAWKEQSGPGKEFVKEDSNRDAERYFHKNEFWCLAGCIIFFAAASVLTVIPEPHYFTASSAVTDLRNGSAKAYGAALHERMELYHSGETDIEVEPLKEKPALLYFSDIKPDAGDWENQGLCRFYGIRSVKVKE